MEVLTVVVAMAAVTAKATRIETMQIMQAVRR
jgi:hypothetical protein